MQPIARIAIEGRVDLFEASAWRSSIASAVDDLLDAIYPLRCWLCGAAADDGFACQEHRPSEQARPRCRRCAVELPRGVPDGQACGACRRDPPAFARAFCVGDYRDAALREWILAFKHGGRRDLSWALAVLVEERLRRARIELGAAALLVPVPLHPVRRFQRGYDQARLLAGDLARLTGLRAVRALRRGRSTPPQGAPGASSRRANVRDAFVARRIARAGLRDRTVWLVDDVVTSGATADECARTLRAAGARDVGVICVARASVDASGEVGDASLLARQAP